jgi:hypothetical protein
MLGADGDALDLEGDSEGCWGEANFEGHRRWSWGTPLFWGRSADGRIFGAEK